MSKTNRLYLHVPKLDELEYRQRILMQPDTMSYNKGYELDFADYDNETGCINFRRENWQNWYSHWINNIPERFYAYVINKNDECPIGEVSFRFDDEYESHMVGIIIEYQHRGKGYCEEALRLLSEKAFVEYGLNKIADDILITRVSAHKAFKNAGYNIKRTHEGAALVELLREDYLRQRIEGWGVGH